MLADVKEGGSTLIRHWKNVLGLLAIQPTHHDKPPVYRRSRLNVVSRLSDHCQTYRTVCQTFFPGMQLITIRRGRCAPGRMLIWETLTAG